MTSDNKGGPEIHGVAYVPDEERPHVKKEDEKLILLIDDDDSMNKCLQRLLKIHGYTCLVASSPEEGLRKMELMKPELILLDLNMPGKDGFTFLHELKSKMSFRNIPVVILSGINKPGIEEESIKNGAAGYLCKPFLLNELVPAIEGYLSKLS